MRNVISTGIALSPDHLTKAKALAQAAGVSRNQLFGLLIESAEVLQPQQPAKLIIKRQEATQDDPRK